MPRMPEMPEEPQTLQQVPGTSIHDLGLHNICVQDISCFRTSSHAQDSEPLRISASSKMAIDAKPQQGAE